MHGGLHLRTDGCSDSSFGNRVLVFFEGAENATLAVLSIGGKLGLWCRLWWLDPESFRRYKTPPGCVTATQWKAVEKLKPQSSVLFVYQKYSAPILWSQQWRKDEITELGASHCCSTGEKRDIMNEYLRGSTGCPFGLSSMKVVSWMLPSASVMSLLIIVLVILTSLLREEIVNMPHTIGIMVFVNLQLHTQIWACKMCAVSLLCSDLPWAHLLFRSW